MILEKKNTHTEKVLNEIHIKLKYIYIYIYFENLTNFNRRTGA